MLFSRDRRATGWPECSCGIVVFLIGSGARVIGCLQLLFQVLFGLSETSSMDSPTGVMYFHGRLGERRARKYISLRRTGRNKELPARAGCSPLPNACTLPKSRKIHALANACNVSSVCHGSGVPAGSAGTGLHGYGTDVCLIRI